MAARRRKNGNHRNWSTRNLGANYSGPRANHCTFPFPFYFSFFSFLYSVILFPLSLSLLFFAFSFSSLVFFLLSFLSCFFYFFFSLLRNWFSCLREDEPPPPKEWLQAYENQETLQQIVAKLRDTKDGLSIADRKYHLRKYPDCFVGT